MGLLSKLAVVALVLGVAASPALAQGRGRGGPGGDDHDDEEGRGHGHGHGHGHGRGPPPELSVCVAEAATLCPNIGSASSPLQTAACLAENSDSITDSACFRAVTTSPFFQCASDALTLCNDARGPREIRDCLQEHAADLSSSCAAAAASQGPPPPPPGPDGPPPPLPGPDGPPPPPPFPSNGSGPFVPPGPPPPPPPPGPPGPPGPPPPPPPPPPGPPGPNGTDDLGVCDQDADLLCADSDGFLATAACLADKVGSIADPDCQLLVSKSPAFQCATDALELCPGASGRSEVRTCLILNAHNLSPTCIAAAAAASASGNTTATH